RPFDVKSSSSSDVLPLTRELHHSFWTHFPTVLLRHLLSCQSHDTLSRNAYEKSLGVAQIATDPICTCNPSNNGDHHNRSSCKYYSGPSDSSYVIEGTCIDQSGTLTCVG
ncbi:hypothetical protein MPER_02471, partial [Moniliophthora perniciosa FA553]